MTAGPVVVTVDELRPGDLAAFGCPGGCAGAVLTPDVLVPSTPDEWLALAARAGVQPPSPRTQALVTAQVAAHIEATHDDPFDGI